ncbi:UNVERIFIED_ORG: hypothetical protein J2W38_000296 [Variovorax paradoxus]|nr:hypothetical protein [Variovorax paradoxus]
MKPPRPSEMWLAHLAGVCVTGALLCGAAALAAAVAHRLVSLL